MSTVLELRNSAENAIRGSARKGSDGTCGENVKTQSMQKFTETMRKAAARIPNWCQIPVGGRTASNVAKFEVNQEHRTCLRKLTFSVGATRRKAPVNLSTGLGITRVASTAEKWDHSLAKSTHWLDQQRTTAFCQVRDKHRISFEPSCQVLLRAQWTRFIADKQKVTFIHKTHSYDGHQWSSKKREETKELWRQLFSATQRNTNLATSIAARSRNFRMSYSRLKQIWNRERI